jgi:hypothetical protein
VADGSPPAAALVVGRGSKGTGAWLQSGVAVEFVAAPALASPQPSCRHGKSSTTSGRLLHVATVLGGGNVTEPLHITGGTDPA